MNENDDQPRRITADDLYRLQLVADPQISPDGEHVIFGVQRVDKEKEKVYTNLWVAPTGGGEVRQFTYGNQTDSHPRWSPDGRRIAFLSNRKDEKQPQIYLLPFHGGEARPLTDLKGSFQTFVWSPDGRQLLCQFRKKDEEALEREQDERKKELGVVDRRITRTGFRMDGIGYFPEERWHLWVVDAESGEATQLTEGDYDETSPAWSPDGAHILFISNRSEDPDLEFYNQDLYVMPAGGGDFRKIETPPGWKMAPVFSPDGRRIAYVSREGKVNRWRNAGLWVVPADGSAPPRNLTAPHDVEVGSVTLGDVYDAPFSPPVWSPNGQKIIFQVSLHGNVTLHSITLDGEMEDVVSRDGTASSFTLDAGREKLAYVWSHFGDPGQLWVQDADGGGVRKLTRLNEAWLRELDLGEMTEVWFKGPAGNDLQGWILKPPGFDQGKRYPSILEIHGGPWTQYGNLFMHEFYLLAANGYVVYFSNPRGGKGYGEEHTQAIHHRWGGADYEDVMAWADYAASKEYVDTSRMGVTGGSYGGYLTLWIIGQTDRFAAAVAQRVVSNALSFWGSSDVGYFFEDTWADNRPPWQTVDPYWEQSPMKYIGNATTPTLLIHSEQDLRCNLEQATQAYLALRQLGVDTELILFPEESHGLSRGGRTDRRVARLNHILRWFDKYLKEGDG